MSHLKNENTKRCLSLLREYIDQSPATEKTKSAALALDQLLKITAGTGTDSTDSETEESDCNAQPRAWG